MVQGDAAASCSKPFRLPPVAGAMPALALEEDALGKLQSPVVKNVNPGKTRASTFAPLIKPFTIILHLLLYRTSSL